MQRKRHDMPFGAQVEPDGGVRFHLWAPGARRVDLCLEDTGPDCLLAMTSEADGWFALTTDQAAPGALYRFRIDGGHRVPDPASRHQPQDVHGPSRVVDPAAWAWDDPHWRGRPWAETVLLELHVGTFTPQGTYTAAIDRLDSLVDLGITAIELMPIADFPGRWSWGYDGVYLFAPDASYGTPDDLKHLVQAAHARGLMVFLDVVYNHFGPEGNYLHLYAPQFFNPRRHTPWGAALDLDSRWVRQYFIHNALFWIEEYGFDGLRLDAVQAIDDPSDFHLLEELAEAVAAGPGSRRPVHLVLENEANQARFLARTPSGAPRWYQAQWNDDLHHVLHHLLTGETGGYYQDYQDHPPRHLGRALTEGFACQGELSPYRRRPRGEISAHLPPIAFVAFLQNHDQVGNRPQGDRLTSLAPPAALRAATAVVLLSPQIPMLFMGQEWGSRRPFPFFCDLEPALAPAIATARRREFKQFFGITDADLLARLPDPGAPDTWVAAQLDWEAAEQPDGTAWLAFHRHLLAIRRREILPLLSGIRQGGIWQWDGRLLRTFWNLTDGRRLWMGINPGPDPRAVDLPAGRWIYRTDGHPEKEGWFVGVGVQNATG
ncbi:MAG: malto-oligosyltrehalose trehalohydrolase [Magnetococcales bacterium]|nr:malto-oligosyltrehalose trehalohydrolase [Magnetococcales bacterium]